MAVFLDTYALIELALKNKVFEKYRSEECITLAGNVAELQYFFLKRDVDSPLPDLERMTIPLRVDLAVRAAAFRKEHAKKGLSFIDCFGYVYAKEHKIPFVTGDRGFMGMENVELIR